MAEDARSAHGSVVRATERLGVLREEQHEQKKQRDAAILSVRSRVAELGDALRGVTDSVHRDEMARDQQRLRIESLEARALNELGIEPDALIEEFGPHQLVPTFEVPSGEWRERESSESSLADRTSDAPEVTGEPVERVVHEKRLRRAEHDLKQLGRVNPLALE